MATAANTFNDRNGGENLKQTYTGTTYGNDHGNISFGKIHKKSDVLSDVMLKASDGEHFMSMDKDGQRPGWTTFMCPGNFQVEAGSNKTEESDTVMINAKNGNIDIIATNGKIRLQANDIELIAFHNDISKGNIKMRASENISGEAKKILLNSSNNSRLVSSGITEVIANSTLKMYGSIISGVSDAVAAKDSKVGGQLYQKLQNIIG